MRPIHVCGSLTSPGPIGGANTELAHTIKLWRSLGLPVAVHRAAAGQVGDILDCPPNAVVVAFCNSRFRQVAPTLRKRGCRLVYAPCMTWLHPQERAARLADVYVCQSNYQRNALLPKLSRLGFTDSDVRLIRGAFSVAEFPFRPLSHVAGEPFIVGRLSRAYGQPGNVPALDKFPRDLWQQYAAVGVPIKARVLGWSAEIERHCGPPPTWAEVLPECAETPQEFLSKVHALAPGMDCCAENWPRVGLEAMAAGVPVVAENHGGWREMIEHDKTGFLCDSIANQSVTFSRLARAESFRQRIAVAARARVEILADPAPIGQQWLDLFQSLDAA